MVNILWKRLAPKGYGLFLSFAMFILTAWGNQRELICHKESNATHTQTHTHTPRGACQCTLYSYLPGVKYFWDGPQNTLLRSMQHAHAQRSPWVGIGQDIFHRQLSAPTCLWYMSSDWLTDQNAVCLERKAILTKPPKLLIKSVSLKLNIWPKMQQHKNGKRIQCERKWLSVKQQAHDDEFIAYTQPSNLQITPWWSIHTVVQSVRHIAKLEEKRKEMLSLAQCTEYEMKTVNRFPVKEMGNS